METIGVVGAGTMGSGIAQVAAQNGHRVVLCEVSLDLAERGYDTIRNILTRQVEKGRLAQAEADDSLARITPTAGLNQLNAASIVIEAVVEDLDAKRRLFAQLDTICPPETILASNTSSLSIGALAGATQRADRVAGMHFFNPPALMTLIEVVRGDATSDATLNALLDLARRWGKTPVVARDTPGFIVNRVARPFYLEALRLLGEGVADAATIDRIVRGGGFRMGPFELMDLIGIDVNFAVTHSVYRAVFDDPRYRPHPIQQRMVESGRLGRKTGRGFYDYGSAAPNPDADRAAGSEHPAVRRPEASRVLIVGELPLADQLARLCAGIGYKVALCTVEQALEADGLTRLRDEATRADIAIDVSAGPIEARRGIVAALDSNLSDGALLLASVLSTTTTQAGSWGAHPERIAGFAALPPFEKDHPVELAAGLRTNTAALDRACAFFESLGAKTAIVKDSVGLVLPRLVCGLVNEAATALAEGVADASDIDLAMRLGTNYPHGPLEWGDAIGLDVVLSVLRGLQDEFGDDRYRPAPLIKQYVRAGWLGQKTSRGFYQYTAH